MKNNDFVYSNFSEFSSYICASWKNLKNEKQLCDLTLACDDKLIETHKVIISSFSPVFRNILKHNLDLHPVIYLRGVSYKELEYLLNFMYCGEVSIAKEDLNNFILVAQDLKIKGLQIESERWNEGDSEPNIANYEDSKVEMKGKSDGIGDGLDLFINQTDYSINNFSSNQNVEKYGISEKNASKGDENSIVTDHVLTNVIRDNVQKLQDNNQIKNEKLNQEGSEKNIKIESENDGIDERNDALKNHADDNMKNFLSENSVEQIEILENKINDLKNIPDEKISKLTEIKLQKFTDHNSTAQLRKKLKRSCVKASMVTKEDKLFLKTNENSTNRKRKRDSVKTLKQQLSCKKCEKEFVSRRSIKRHNEIVHEGIRYACDECDYKAREISKLKIHIESIHRGIRHQCNICDFVSARKTYLKMHMDALHEGKRFPCKKCNYQSTSRRMLARHTKKYSHL